MFYEIDFGVLVNGERPSEAESGASIAIKAKRELSIEEAEKLFAEYMKLYGCNCVVGVYEVDKSELLGNYDNADDADNWQTWG